VEIFKKLWPCLKGYRLYALLTSLFVVVEVVFEVLIPLVMANIIDIGIPSGNISYVLRLGGLMIIMSFVSLIFGATSGRFAAVSSMGFAKNIRKKLFACVQEFSFANIDKFSTPSLITRLTTDITNTQNAFMMLVRILVRAPVMLVCATAMAVMINQRLAAVFFVAVPFLAIALYIIGVKAFPLFQIMLSRYDRLNATVQENLMAIRVVKAFVRSDYENKKFYDSADALRIAQRRAEKILAFNMPAMQLVVYSCMMAIVWFGGNMIIVGDMLTGELMSFLTYVMQILISLMMISMVFVMLILSKASVTRIVEVMNEKIDITDDDARGDVQPADGSIVFEDVSFSYSRREDNLTLENINLQIKSGETIGIIGGTGSAKTTLVQLIPRLYDVLSGRVLVGGHDVRDYKLAVLRDAVAMVLQKNVLFSGTIEENLKWGNANASQEEVAEACQAAQAHDFVTAFPGGYQTDLGQGGVNVSGGQKQRLCIARALLKKPKIIILDDSTSAVDTATDSRIRQAFRENLADTTKIIIAQRIASVCEADRIVVLHEGKINDVGTHDELMNRNQIYREVYESQQKGVA